MSCPECSIKYMEFRAGGRLGCPLDYWVFARGFTPLLQRFHGATRHVGKVARRRDGAMERLRLRTQLRQAVTREDYEEACAAARFASPQGSPRMTLEDLTKTSGEWLRGTGPESDIVMCSRIRLARNLADFPFSNRASRGEKAEIESHFNSALLACQSRTILYRRQWPLDPRPPVPGRAPDHFPRACHQ